MQLTGPARDRFVAIAHERAHLAGDTLIREADEGREVFLMLSGKAIAYVPNAAGNAILHHSKA